jgi:ABC-type multidrug transport system ATPase subunit
VRAGTFRGLANFRPELRPKETRHHRPQLLILDEPTAGQDYRHYSEIMEFLKGINALGITVILITHDMHLMLEYTPRAIVLAGGQKIADTAASVVLTDRKVIEEANLKETSLFQLASMAGIPDGTQFVQNFIDYEKGAAQ